MKNILTLLSFTAILLLTNTCLYSQNPPAEVVTDLQQILDNAVASTGSSGGAIIGISVPGQWEWFGATGSAKWNNVTPASAVNKFRIGSISKSFGTVAMLQLKEAGLLNLDDQISQYLRPGIISDTIPNSSLITIRQLLNHTSGINELADNTGCMMDFMYNMSQTRTLEEAIYCGASLGALFTPGTSWEYSNTNYSLVAMLIEEISNKTYEQYLLDSIFIPAGLNDTEIPAVATISSPHMGCYWGTYSLDMTNVHPSNYKGWAGIVSTTSDLIKYFKALENGSLISTTSFDEMFTSTTPAASYGLGTELSGDANETYNGHSGEVGNTSGWYRSTLSTSTLIDGYYICYNFNYQGANIAALIDEPFYDYMTSYIETKISGVKPIELTADVYPNPATDMLNISNKSGETITITILNPEGKILKSFQAKEGTVSFSLTGIPDGLYVYKLSGEMYFNAGKLVITSR